MAVAGARRGAFLLFALAAAAATLSAAEAKAFAGEEAATKCPLGAAKADFDLARVGAVQTTKKKSVKLFLFHLSTVGMIPHL